jgi:hypothetical protein
VEQQHRSVLKSITGRRHHRLQNLQHGSKCAEKANHHGKEPMYIQILNDDLVGFANTMSSDMFDHLFLSYGSIT